MPETRKLRAQFSMETTADLERAFGLRVIETELGVPHKFVSKVRPWQFWRWHLLGTKDYVLSRAGEIIMIHRVAEACTTESTQTGRMQAREPNLSNRPQHED